MDGKEFSGIRGLDALMGGGLNPNTITLVSGSCGSGKFMLGMQFLLQAVEHNEKGLYLSFDETEAEVVENANALELNTEELIKQKKLFVKKPDLYDFERFLESLENDLQQTSAKRLVINSFTHIGQYFSETYKIREALIDLIKLLKRLQVTTILIGEIPEHSGQISSFGVEEFLADNVIVLQYHLKENYFVRRMQVRKMKQSTHSMEWHPFVIKPRMGIQILPMEKNN